MRENERDIVKRRGREIENTRDIETEREMGEGEWERDR